MKILHIDASPRGERSISRQLAAEARDMLSRAYPDLSVVYRDVGRDTIPHLTEAWIEGAYAAPDERTPAARDAIALSDQLVDELLAAELVLISSPMYNFTVPSSLKAWIDHVVRPGRTFSADMKGLARDRKVIVITARSGDYSPGTPLAAYDHQEPTLRTVFGFIGITDLSFVHAQGISSKGDARERALTTARAELAEIIDSL